MIKTHVSRYWYKYNFVIILRWAEMGFNKINRYTNCEKHSLEWRLWLDTVTLLSGPVTKMYCVLRTCVFSTTCSGGLRRRALTTRRECVSICLCIWRVPLCHTVGTVPLCHTVLKFLCVTLYVQVLCATLYVNSSSVSHCTYSSSVPHCMWSSSVPHCTYSSSVPRCTYSSPVPRCTQILCATLYLQPYDGSIFEPKNVMR